MCGGENTARPANVRAGRQERAARALPSGREFFYQKSSTFLTESAPEPFRFGGACASLCHPCRASARALLLPQTQAVGDHGDELRIRRLALDVRNRVAEKLLQRLQIAAIPRDLDRVAYGALNA